MLKNTGNLLNLQNLMKRDPSAYLEEFHQQHRSFESALAIQSSKTDPQNGKQTKDFMVLVKFLAHVAPCFKQQITSFPTQLLHLLEHNGDELTSDVRVCLVESLMMLSNREMIDRLIVLPVFFQLFRIPDKHLRSLLFQHIVHDIRRLNKASQHHRLNTTLQNFMFTMLRHDTEMAARKSLDVMIELWRRRVWTDAKTVNAMAQACFSHHTRVMASALHFFLGIEHYTDKKLDPDASDDENDPSATRKQGKQSQLIKEVKAKHAMLRVAKPSKRKKREREIKRATRKINSLGGEHSSVRMDCPAIQLIYDPQNFAEKLFGQLKKSTNAFDLRMLMMNVISRLIGAHKLILLNFYPFLQRYMQPHQKNVTHILVYLAQASHDLVPPDVLKPCIQTLANHFVTDRSSPEVTAVGLNAIREVCARAPLTMDRDLLLDLAQYKKSKSKGVMMAARSLIALYRDVNPSLLHKRDRGKVANMEDPDDLEYGEIRYRSDVIGADLLAQIQPVEGPQDDPWDMVSAPTKDDSDEEPETEHKSVLAYLEEKAEMDESDDEDMDEKENDIKDGDENDIKDGDENEDVDGNEDGDGEEIEMEMEGEEDEEDGDEADGDEDEGEEQDEDEASRPVKKLKTSETTSEEKTAASISSTSTTRQLPIGATRIFTPADFEAMRQARIQAALDPSRAGKKAKRKRYDGTTSSLTENLSETVSPSDIVGWVKKTRLDKKERLSSILEGRGGEEKKEKAGGTTNADKAKLKPYMMVKQKAKKKHSQSSFKAKQEFNAKHIKTQKVQNKRIKKKLSRHAAKKK